MHSESIGRQTKRASEDFDAWFEKVLPDELEATLGAASYPEGYEALAEAFLQYELASQTDNELDDQRLMAEAEYILEAERLYYSLFG